MQRVVQLRDMQEFGNSGATFFTLPGGYVWHDDGSEDGRIFSPREWANYLEGALS